MRRSSILITTWVLIGAAGLAWAQKGKTPGSTRAVPAPTGRGPVPLTRTFKSTTVTPDGVSFAATNPDTDSPVPGNPTGPSATVAWSVQSFFDGGGSWTLTIAPSSSTFTGCVTVPATAVAVACTSATASGGTAACTSTGTYVALPSTGTLTVAQGTYPVALFNTFNYTVLLNYQLTDSWEYVANTCPLTVTYTVN